MGGVLRVGNAFYSLGEGLEDALSMGISKALTCTEYCCVNVHET
jgi:hypothetical protein